MAGQNFIARKRKQFQRWNWRAKRKLNQKQQELNKLIAIEERGNLTPGQHKTLWFLKRKFQAEITSASDKLANVEMDKTKLKEIASYKDKKADAAAKEQIKADQEMAREIYENSVKIRDSFRQAFKESSRKISDLEIKLATGKGVIIYQSSSGKTYGLGSVNKEKTKIKIDALKRDAEDSKLDHDIVQAMMKNAKFMPIEEAKKFEQMMANFEEVRKVRDEIKAELIAAEEALVKAQNRDYWLFEARPTVAMFHGMKLTIADLKSDREIANSLIKGAAKTPEGMQRLSEQLAAFNEVRAFRDQFRNTLNMLELDLEKNCGKLYKSYKKPLIKRGEPEQYAHNEAAAKIKSLIGKYAILQTGPVTGLVNLSKQELKTIQSFRQRDAAKADYEIARQIMQDCRDPVQAAKASEKMTVLEEIKSMRELMRENLEKAEESWSKINRKRTAKELLSGTSEKEVFKTWNVRSDEERRTEYLLGDYNATQKMFEDLKDVKPITLEALNKVKKDTETLNEARSVRDYILDDLKINGEQIEKISSKMSTAQWTTLDRKLEYLESSNKAMREAKTFDQIVDSESERSKYLKDNFVKKDAKHLMLMRERECSKSDLAVVGHLIKDAGDNYKTQPEKMASLTTKIQLFNELRNVRDGMREAVDLAELKFLTKRRDYSPYRKNPFEKMAESRKLSDAYGDFDFTQRMMDKFKPPAEVTVEKLKEMKQQFDALIECREHRNKLREEIFELTSDIPKLKTESVEKVKNFKNEIDRIERSTGHDSEDKASEIGDEVKKLSKKELKAYQVDRNVNDAKQDYNLISETIRETEKFLESNNDPKMAEKKIGELKKTLENIDRLIEERNSIRETLEKAERKLRAAEGARFEYYSRLTEDRRSDYKFYNSMLGQLTPPVASEKMAEVQKAMREHKEVTILRDEVLKDLRVHAARLDKYNKNMENVKGHYSEKDFKAANRKLIKHQRRFDDTKDDHLLIQSMIKQAENTTPHDFVKLKKDIENYKDSLSIRDTLRTKLETAERHQLGFRSRNSISYKSYNDRKANDFKEDYDFSKKMIKNLKLDELPVTEEKLSDYKTIMSKQQNLAESRDELRKLLRKHELKAESNKSSPEILKRSLRAAKDAKNDYEVIQGLLRNAEADPSKLPAAFDEVTAVMSAYKKLASYRDWLDKEINKAEDGKNSIIYTKAQKDNLGDKAVDLQDDHAAISKLIADTPKTEKDLKAAAEVIQKFDELKSIRDGFARKILESRDSIMGSLEARLSKAGKEYRKDHLSDLRDDYQVARNIVNAATPLTLESVAKANEQIEKLKIVKEIQDKRDEVRVRIKDTQQEIVKNKKNITTANKDLKSARNSVYSWKRREPRDKKSFKHRLWRMELARRTKNERLALKKIDKYKTNALYLDRKLKDLTQEYTSYKALVRNAANDPSKIDEQHKTFKEIEKRSIELDVRRNELLVEERTKDKFNADIRKEEYKVDKLAVSAAVKIEKIKKRSESLEKMKAELKHLEDKPFHSSTDKAKMAALKFQIDRKEKDIESLRSGLNSAETQMKTSREEVTKLRTKLDGEVTDRISYSDDMYHKARDETPKVPLPVMTKSHNTSLKPAPVAPKMLSREEEIENLKKQIQFVESGAKRVKEDLDEKEANRMAYLLKPEDSSDTPEVRADKIKKMDEAMSHDNKRMVQQKIEIDYMREVLKQMEAGKPKEAAEREANKLREAAKASEEVRAAARASEKAAISTAMETAKAEKLKAPVAVPLKAAIPVSGSSAATVEKPVEMAPAKIAAPLELPKVHAPAAASSVPSATVEKPKATVLVEPSKPGAAVLPIMDVKYDVPAAAAEPLKPAQPAPGDKAPTAEKPAEKPKAAAVDESLKPKAALSPSAGTELPATSATILKMPEKSAPKASPTPKTVDEELHLKSKPSDATQAVAFAVVTGNMGVMAKSVSSMPQSSKASPLTSPDAKSKGEKLPLFASQKEKSLAALAGPVPVKSQAELDAEQKLASDREASRSMRLR